MLGQTQGKFRKRVWRMLAAGVCASAAVAATAVAAKRFGEWGAPVSAEQGSHPEFNTAFNDGCPILSPDGLTLYMATNRMPGGLGSNDIWVSRRKSTRHGWGQPVPLPPPVNSASNDFCPTPVRGNGLFFVSNRGKADPLDGDIYFTRFRKGSWEEPIRLGPNINSPLEEWSPSYFEDERGNQILYFSRNAQGTNTHDIYESVNFGPARLAPGQLNSPASEARPNVRRDGLEIVFDSNRLPNLGAQDVWTATRRSTRDPWPAPTHLPGVSSAATDTRASLSWDGSILLVGSGRPFDAAGRPNEGPADIYVSTRERIRNGDDGDDDDGDDDDRGDDDD